MTIQTVYFSSRSSVNNSFATLAPRRIVLLLTLGEETKEESSSRGLGASLPSGEYIRVARYHFVKEPTNRRLHTRAAGLWAGSVPWRKFTRPGANFTNFLPRNLLRNNNARPTARAVFSMPWFIQSQLCKGDDNNHLVWMRPLFFAERPITSRAPG